MRGAEAGEYHSKDFEWETLKQEVENDASLQFHRLPFHSPFSSSSQQPPPEEEEQEEATHDSYAWQKFHLRHSSGKFFKERRYLLKEFPELLSSGGHCPKLLEVGCGNGSSVLPILRGNESIEVYACDCSSEILDTTREMLDGVVGVQRRLHLFQCDFANSGFPNWLKCHSCRGTFGMTQRESFLTVEDASALVSSGLPPSEASECCLGGVDFVTLIFVLSAVPLKRMPKAIRECYSILKPGGLLFFRDYGLYDMTMLRFTSDKRVGFREYMRSDGTRSYFFSLDVVRDLFLGAGFVEIELEYCCINSVNHQKGKCMQRVWVHGKFQRPMHCRQ